MNANQRSVRVQPGRGWPGSVETSRRGRPMRPTGAVYDYVLLQGKWCLCAVFLDGVVIGSESDTHAITWSSYDLGRAPTWVLDHARENAPRA